MQKIEIHDIKAMLSQMNDELVTFQDYKQNKIQKIYEFFKLDREKLKTITYVVCSKELFPIFAYYFKDVIKVHLHPDFDIFTFSFGNDDDIQMYNNPKYYKAMNLAFKKEQKDAWERINDEVKRYNFFLFNKMFS